MSTKFEVLATSLAESAGEYVEAVGAVTSTDKNTDAPPHARLLHRPPESAVVVAEMVSKPVTVNVALLASVNEVGPKDTCEVSVLKTV